ncbi:MAG: class I SAM-dependent methyltransferase [Myxococcales bacterium]|nr:class I SAM-dependent methyltransferase [Myxococcales bacterium]
MVGGTTLSYRDSHRRPGYGRYYERTYEHGYYAEQWRRIERPLLAGMLRELHDHGARSLLDFACGTGRILELAETIFDDTWGVDVSATMQELARERCPRSTLRLQDITEEPLPRRFDVVTAFRFFLNAEEPLRRRVLRAIEASLEPGGVLIANVHVSSTSPVGWFYRARSHLRPAKRAKTLSLSAFGITIETMGLRVLEVRRYGYMPRPGPLLPGLAGRLVEPIERLCEATPLVPASLAQSFLVVCGREGEEPRWRGSGR